VLTRCPQARTGLLAIIGLLERDDPSGVPAIQGRRRSLAPSSLAPSSLAPWSLAIEPADEGIDLSHLPEEEREQARRCIRALSQCAGNQTRRHARDRAANAGLPPIAILRPRK
jgi:hypothetical protein